MSCNPNTSSPCWNLSARAAGLRKRAGMTAAAVLFGAASLGTAWAQSAPDAAILANGNAVITGFSGVTAYRKALGTDPADQETIDLKGPSARVVDLQGPGTPPEAQLLPAPKPFT